MWDVGCGGVGWGSCLTKLRQGIIFLCFFLLPHPFPLKSNSEYGGGGEGGREGERQRERGGEEEEEGEEKKKKKKEKKKKKKKKEEEEEELEEQEEDRGLHTLQRAFCLLTSTVDYRS